MKTALSRILAIATLASSMAALAATDEPKRNETATATSARHQGGCPEGTSHAKQKETKPSQNDEQKEKELDRLLMGTYG